MNISLEVPSPYLCLPRAPFYNFAFELAESFGPFCPFVLLPFLLHSISISFLFCPSYLFLSKKYDLDVFLSIPSNPQTPPHLSVYDEQI